MGRYYLGSNMSEAGFSWCRVWVYLGGCSEFPTDILGWSQSRKWSQNSPLCRGPVHRTYKILKRGSGETYITWALVRVSFTAWSYLKARPCSKGSCHWFHLRHWSGTLSVMGENYIVGSEIGTWAWEMLRTLSSCRGRSSLCKIRGSVVSGGEGREILLRRWRFITFF